MSMKKILTILLAIVFVTMGLAGCEFSDEKKGTPVKDTYNVLEVAKAQGKTINCGVVASITKVRIIKDAIKEGNWLTVEGAGNEEGSYLIFQIDGEGNIIDYIYYDSDSDSNPESNSNSDSKTDKPKKGD